MPKTVNICKDYETFLQYFKQYLRHYKRKLSPKSYYSEPNTLADRFAYLRASERKQCSNTFYNQRYRLLTPYDPWLTVIYANSHRFALAGTYSRRIHGVRIAVFVVITQYTVYEWYISDNPTEPTYIGRVPPWRTYYHWWKVDNKDLTATNDEEAADVCYKEEY